jgi:uroporphyrinogen III methyltransferase/synthase
MHTGKVYLVGAGPGDPGLITVRGRQLLGQCDAVVYDRLIPLELVVTLPASVERHYVGKIAGRHALEQSQINELLARLAQEGRTVVRLKGGDPLVFGRGSEEAAYLKERGIPYELVPGVTAGLAASACTGIPVTHRGKSVYVVMITAHEAGEKQELQVPWDWLAQSRNGTLVGYMGVTQLPQVTQRLMEGGMDPGTPAAMIERGATARQRIVTGTLADLPRRVQDAGITPPALFIIGEVVSFHADLDWIRPGPLWGKKVMVTRPADQAGEMYGLLRELGAYVMPFPTIATREHEDLQGWEELAPFFEAPEAPRSGWLVCTSENGVRYFLRQFLKRYDYRALAGFRIAAVGAGTSRELARCGLRADFLPSQATTAALAKELAPRAAQTAATVIRVRGNLGDDRVESALESAGAKVHVLQVYATSTAPWDEGLRTHLDRNAPDVVTFTSGSSCTGLIEILGANRARELTAAALVASIGPSTSQVIRAAGLKVDLEAQIHSVPGLVAALAEHFGS